MMWTVQKRQILFLCMGIHYGWRQVALRQDDVDGVTKTCRHRSLTGAFIGKGYLGIGEDESKKKKGAYETKEKLPLSKSFKAADRLRQNEKRIQDTRTVSWRLFVHLTDIRFVMFPIPVQPRVLTM